LGIPFAIAAIIVAASLKMANTWEKFVILRAGKLRGVKGPWSMATSSKWRPCFLFVSKLEQSRVRREEKVRFHADG
jgi:hypothetical protein